MTPANRTTDRTSRNGNPKKAIRHRPTSTATPPAPASLRTGEPYEDAINEVLNHALGMATERMVYIEHRMIDLVSNADQEWNQAFAGDDEIAQAQKNDTYHATRRAQRLLGAAMLAESYTAVRVIANDIEREFPTPAGKAVAERLREFDRKDWVLS